MGTTGAVTASNSVLGTVVGGGISMNFVYDLFHTRLIVGQPSANRVSLFGVCDYFAATGDKAVLPAIQKAKDALRKEFGFEIPAVLLRQDELGKLIAANPYAGPVIDVDLPRWNKTFQVNVTAPLVWTQLAWNLWMREHGGSDGERVAVRPGEGFSFVTFIGSPLDPH